MLQLEDILLLVFLQLQSALLSGQTRLRCFLFAHEGGSARRLRDPDTRQSGFLQHKEERNSCYFPIRFIGKSLKIQYCEQADRFFLNNNS